MYHQKHNLEHRSRLSSTTSSCRRLWSSLRNRLRGSSHRHSNRLSTTPNSIRRRSLYNNQRRRSTRKQFSSRRSTMPNSIRRRSFSISRRRRTSAATAPLPQQNRRLHASHAPIPDSSPSPAASPSRPASLHLLMGYAVPQGDSSTSVDRIPAKHNVVESLGLRITAHRITTLLMVQEGMTWRLFP